MKYDVIVAGGGPAGATCAEILAKNGVDVILFEKGTKDRYKTCAGGLMWHNEQDFGPLPKYIIEREVEHLFLAGPTQNVDLNSQGNGRLGQLTYRTRLDCYLRQTAEKNGATIVNNTAVDKATRYSDHIEIEVDDNCLSKTVKADTLVIATGASKTQLQRDLRMDRPTDIEQAIIGEFALPSAVIEERFGGGAYDLYFNSHITPHGYIWIFTKSEGVSVGMCDKFVKINQFNEILERHPIISKKLEGAKPVEFDGKHIWAAPIPDRLPEYIYSERVLEVGDAAGFSDRFTYEGIWHARYSGKMAAETLIKARNHNDYSASYLQKYQIKCKKIFDTVQSSLRMHHLIYHSGYMDLIIDTIAEILQEPTFGKEIVSNIQLILEGFLEPGNEVASLGVMVQKKLLDTLKEKVDKTTLKRINREIDYALAIS